MPTSYMFLTVGYNECKSEVRHKIVRHQFLLICLYLKVGSPCLHFFQLYFHCSNLSSTFLHCSKWQFFPSCYFSWVLPYLDSTLFICLTMSTSLWNSCTSCSSLVKGPFFAFQPHFLSLLSADTAYPLPIERAVHKIVEYTQNAKVA